MIKGDSYHQEKSQYPCFYGKACEQTSFIPFIYKDAELSLCWGGWD